MTLGIFLSYILINAVNYRSLLHEHSDRRDPPSQLTKTFLKFKQVWRKLDSIILLSRWSRQRVYANPGNLD